MGWFLRLALASVFACFAFGRGQITILGHPFGLPKPGQALALTGAAILDFLGTSLAIYMLMPADLAVNFPAFFIVFVIAVALAIFGNSTGGRDVFEATLLVEAGAGGRSDAIAALLLCRVAHTGLPFVIAAFGLAFAELRWRRVTIVSAGAAVRTAIQVFVPFVSAAVAVVSGALLVLSGNLPAVGQRLELLRDIVPLGVVEISHLTGSVIGVLLLVVARGLFRKI